MSWATDILFETVKSSGTLVKPEVAIARVQICETRNGGTPCEYAGTVNPLPFVYARGCTKCGCPFETKPLMDTCFSLETLQMEKVECPHPLGNMWASADNIKN